MDTFMYDVVNIEPTEIKKGKVLYPAANKKNVAVPEGNTCL